MTTHNENRFHSKILLYGVAVSLVISTKDLHAEYGDVKALADVNIEVYDSCSLAVIGPNGSGKSTLLGILAGTVRAASGGVTVKGPPPAFVLQATNVDRSLPITVRDTVALARYPSLGVFNRFGSADAAAIHTAMERLQIDNLATTQLHDLSGGQRQRVLVAQGLAQESNVLLLDEPVSGLDVTSRSIILGLIDEEVAAGRTVVVTTHSLEEAQRCHQVLLLKTRPIAYGPPDEVLVEDYLQVAFGGNFIRVGDKLILDDPHHHH